MALSTGGLAAIILLLMLLHAGTMIGYYFLLQKDPSLTDKCALDEKVHGILRWVLVGLISLSWIFSVAATASCSFLNIDVPFVGEMHFGFNSVEEDGEGGCTSFDSTRERNGAAYTFAVFNCLLTTAGVVGILLLQFFVLAKGRKRTWMALRIGMYISLWCCLFSFYIRQAPICDVLDCSLGGAGVTQVFNVLFLIVIVVLLFLIPVGEDVNTNRRQNQQASLEQEEDRNLNGEGENEMVETETHHLPDASIEHEVETTNPEADQDVGRNEQVETESHHLPDAPVQQQDLETTNLEEDQDLNESENKKVESETHLPDDGSIQRRKVETTNPDGSKTVTTTTIERLSSERKDDDDNDFVIVSDDDDEDNIEKPSAVDSTGDDTMDRK
eukprot:scaffold16125_cov52-Cylindrotheca_fusiformis.AAC.2